MEPVKTKPEPVVKKSEPVKEKTTAEAMKRLSKSNPGLYKLLKADNLVESAEGETDSQEFEDDDRDIAYWEKKLGLNKKKTKALGKEFEEDGLLELLGGIEGEEGDDDQEYLRKKRQRQVQKKKGLEMEGKAEEAVDDIFAGLDSDESMEENSEEEESDNDEEATNMEDSDNESLVIGEDDIDSDEEALNEQEESEAESEEESEAESEEETKPVEPVKSNVLSKYVPPHLRKTATTKSEQQMKLHKQLMGQLNRLSESNMESILLEIEKCYGSYPRHGKIIFVSSIINSIR